MSPHNPDCVYRLFLQYAKWEGHGGGIHNEDVGKLLFELDLLSGIPASLYSAYLREHILRADQDKDGLLSVNEFMIWFFSEVALLIPVGPHGAKQRGCAPLYNQFVYYMGVGIGQGSRKGATALQEGQFQRLCRDVGILQRGAHHGGVVVAKSRASSQRRTSQLEAGSKLQLARLLSSLFSLGASKSLSMDAILYKVCADGLNPPSMSHDDRPDPRQTLEDLEACYLGGEGLDDGEGQHTREAYNRLRSIFHRYNLKINSGMAPPRAPRPVWASFGGEQWEDEAPSPRGGAPSSPAGPAGPRSGDAWAECCCRYKTLTLMELPAWRKVCADCGYMAAQILDPHSHLTPQRIETAFLVACSVGGLNSHDKSMNVHDRPVSGAPFHSPRSLIPTTNRLGSRPSSPYGTPFTLSTTSSACAQRSVEPTSPSPGTSGSQGAWGPPGSSWQYRSGESPWGQGPAGAGGGATGTRAEHGARPAHAHRAPVPTLNFLQFVEALRLVAVYSAGPTLDRLWPVELSRILSTLSEEPVQW